MPVPVGVDTEIAAFLNQWIKDWQAKNAAAFFSHYVPEFRGSSASRPEWEAVTRPPAPRIVFRQVYISDIGNDVFLKAMFLTKREGRWMIEREFATLDSR